MDRTIDLRGLSPAALEPLSHIPDVNRLFRRGRGVAVLVGPAGSGKSRVVLRQLGSTHNRRRLKQKRIVWVAAGPTVGPGSLLSDLLLALGGTGLPSRTVVDKLCTLRAIIAHYRTRLIVIDDIHLVDDASNPERFAPLTQLGKECSVLFVGRYLPAFLGFPDFQPRRWSSESAAASFRPKMVPPEATWPETDEAGSST